MTSNGANHALRRRWIVRAATAVVVAGSVTGLAASLTAAEAAPAAAHKLKVVKVVTRKPFGKMLATTKGKGLSLYYQKTGTCTTSGCLTIWPALELSKGSKATPTGVSCLGTAKLGKRTQITYRGHRLFRYYLDSGASVNGNNLGGFHVMKLTSGKCPK
jgi:hypothetical protein